MARPNRQRSLAGAGVRAFVSAAAVLLILGGGAALLAMFIAVGWPVEGAVKTSSSDYSLSFSRLCGVPMLELVRDREGRMAADDYLAHVQNQGELSSFRSRGQCQYWLTLYRRNSVPLTSLGESIPVRAREVWSLYPVIPSGDWGYAAWCLVWGIPISVCIVRCVRAIEREAAGRCERCGYDLRGNVSGRCPECGEYVTGAVAPVSGD